MSRYNNERAYFEDLLYMEQHRKIVQERIILELYGVTRRKQ